MVRIYSALDTIYAEIPHWQWANEERAKEPISQGPYYHGTTVPNLTHILPAAQTGNSFIHTDETDPHHTYATSDIDDAWDYAQSGNGAPGRPRVYEVEPLGGHESLEHDPPFDQKGRRRYVGDEDLRTTKGFRVKREIPAPPHIRENYSDEEWNRLAEQEKRHANPLGH